MERTLLDIHDRVSVLETKQLTDRELLDEIKKMVQDMHDEMTRYKGFLGAIAFFGSCLAVAGGFLRDWITRHWT